MISQRKRELLQNNFPYPFKGTAVLQAGDTTKAAQGGQQMLSIYGN